MIKPVAGIPERVGAAVAGPFFLAFGGFLASYGVHDLVKVPDVAVSLTAFLALVAGGLLLFAGLAMLVGKSEMRYAIGILGSAVAFVTALVLLASRYSVAGDARPWDPAWWVILVLALAIAGALWRRADLEKITFGRGLKATTGFVTAGVLVSLFQFGYTNFYVPQHEIPAASLEATLEKLGERDDGTVVLRGNVSATNTSDVQTQALRSLWQVTTAEGTVLGAAEPFDAYGKLDQDEVLTRDFLVHVPPEEATGPVRLVFSMVVSRESLALEPTPTGERDEREHVDEGSWLRGLTRGRRYVGTIASLETPTVDFCGDEYPTPLVAYLGRGSLKDPRRGCDADYSRDLAEYYGVFSTDTSTELDLDIPASPPADPG